MLSRKYASAVLAELIGTFMLTLVVLTVSKSSIGLPFFISLAAGLALTGTTLLFGRISGAQLNPAITVGLFSAKRLDSAKALTYIIAQLIGGIVAYFVFSYLSGQKWRSGAHFETKLIIAEILGTFLFSLGWAAVVYQKLELSKASAIVGISFFLALLAVSSASTALLNPALALGLRSWVWGSSVFGPLVGAVAGFQVYKYVFATEATEAKSQTALTTNRHAARVPEHPAALKAKK